MSFSDPSAIILIVGAIAILIFLIHGLWFSGKPINKKINSNDSKEMEFQNLGKVRIVTVDKPSDDLELQRVEEELDIKVNNNNIEEVENKTQYKEEPWQKSYEINLVAPLNMPFKGEDIEAICDEFCILRGEMDIFYVYENPQTRKDEVFRICSLEKPFSFPQDMTGYTTTALALYMNLPEKGKGFAYFKSIKVAANIFLDKLGGELQDNYHNIITEEQLEKMANDLRLYDES